ncbi:MAG: T9SS type A sorting domain-containing protein, partial [Fibrobacteres bacterium]|nr:T9SS type A sorting domain-containing protein [Fibrobacterota bacterium]
DFGIAVAPNGHLAAMTALPYIGLTPTAVRYHPVSDTQTAPRKVVLLNNIAVGGGGVAFDLKGNLYVGQPIRSAGAGLPTVITTDLSWTKSTGSIYRYNKTGSLDGDLFSAPLTAVDKIYDVDFGQYGGGTSSRCDCMTAGFGMDDWGRLYVPNGPFQKISVLDNEGNRTLRFGNYGNIENAADEAKGIAGTAGKCYMAYPFNVKATDDYIYATDPGNLILSRFQKTFVLDNEPTISTVIENSRHQSALALSVYPNPLMAGSKIQITLPSVSSISLELVDLNGRLVKKIASGSYSAGNHNFVWNNKAAAGVYLLRLQSGKSVQSRKVVLTR